MTEQSPDAPSRPSGRWIPYAAVGLTAVVAVATGGITLTSNSGGGKASAQSSAVHKNAAPAAVIPSHVHSGPPPVLIQPPLLPIESPAQQGEGMWHPLTTAYGQPVVQGTELRPGDGGDTVAVAWISQGRVRFVLHPGTDEPGGGPWSQPTYIPEGQRQNLVATWNGAFKIGDLGSAFYLDGQQANDLTGGKASEVFYRDGSLRIGRWGRDFGMTPDVIGVRQQGDLLVDNGQVSSDIDDLFYWGVTDGGATFVRRSGVGVTQGGDIVYAIGGSLSPRGLADVLRHAGAVRAMELDINISWPSFMAYDGFANPADPTPIKWGDYPRTVYRYYEPSLRDFVAVYARPMRLPAGLR